MQIKYKEMPLFRRFGVELEVSATTDKQNIGTSLDQYEFFIGLKKSVRVTPATKGWAETKENNYWHVKYDSTCGPLGKGNDYGWEIASYIGSGSPDLRNISKAAGWLGLSLETNKNCGLHVHVDASDFTARAMGHLLLVWMKVEDALFHICDPCRSESHYCRSLRSRLTDKNGYTSMWASTPYDFWHLMRPTDYSTHNNEEKKYALNTVGFAMGQIVDTHTRKTVELRLPECRLSQEHVFGWTGLFLNFVHTVSSIPTPLSITQDTHLDDLLWHLGLAGRDRFFLPGPHLLRVKQWFLQKLSEADFFMASEASKRLEFISGI